MIFISRETAVIVVTSLTVLLWVVFRGRRRGYGHKLPGPRGLPFLGTIRFPGGPHWETYSRWSKEYGSDIIGIKALGNNIVILNSQESAVDLLDKRSYTYSDRPTSGITMLSELCGMGCMFPFQCYTQEWRDGRKAFSREFNANAVKKWQPHEQRATILFLDCLLAEPKDFISHTRSMAGGMILRIAYGIEIRSEKDPLLIEAEVATHVVTATLVPGSYLVDLFPILKYIPEWFPGATFKTQAKQWRRSVMYSLHKPWDLVKDRMARTTDTHVCVASSLITNMVNTAQNPSYMEGVVRTAIGSMHLAGSDTIISAVLTFFLAMTLYPDVQRRAQASVDRICLGRLPSFADYHSLAYVHAVVKECLRWHPIASINFAHVCSKDDVYRQYFIPKGSIVIANIWAMLHDPQTYPNPDQFIPERYLAPTMDDDDVTLDPNAPDPATTAFGFGRRICPGKFMAHESLWLVIASILAVFNITKAVDENGQVVTPEEKYKSVFIVTPEPFVCNITARSAAHGDMVREAVQEL